VIPSEDPANPLEVDARGLLCPLPVIRLAEAARNAPAGTRIVLLASDPAARYDIPAWCRMRDHELHEMAEVSNPSGPGDSAAAGARPTCLRFVVLIGPQPSKADGTGTGSARSSRAR
jgi:tRNA 2-thiouridine synthesizing protein A